MNALVVIVRIITIRCIQQIIRKILNCDVPSYSIAFGNPCLIKLKENATVGCINNKYEYLKI